MNQDLFHEPTILYVDDQPSHLVLFKKAFQGDYLVLTASSGEEGLKILGEHDIFLVIADHHMPRMSGIDFLQKAKVLSPKVISAILSAYVNDEIIRETRKVGAIECLAKPWKLDLIRKFIVESYQRYEIDRVFPPPEKQIETPVQPPLGPRHLLRFMEKWEGKIDERGKKRIFLNFVEPPLREFVPPIRRPAAPLLRKVQEGALQGDFEALQMMLAFCLKAEAEDLLYEVPSDRQEFS